MGVNVEYSSNNSGGRWWLTDANWRALEEAGWTVDWMRNREDMARYLDSSDPTAEPRWLGALAKSASKVFPSLKEGVDSWEEITGECASDMGCNCCGAPHSFSGTDTETGETTYPSIRTQSWMSYDD